MSSQSATRSERDFVVCTELSDVELMQRLMQAIASWGSHYPDRPHAVKALELLDELIERRSGRQAS